MVEIDAPVVKVFLLLADPEQYIVNTFAIGRVQTEQLEPSGTGTRWTHTATMQTRVPLLDKLEVLLAVAGHER